MFFLNPILGGLYREFSDLHENLSCTITPGSMNLLNCENYQRGRVFELADTELVLLIAHLIRPPGSIPDVGWVRRNQTMEHSWFYTYNITFYDVRVLRIDYAASTFKTAENYLKLLASIFCAFIFIQSSKVVTISEVQVDI